MKRLAILTILALLGAMLLSVLNVGAVNPETGCDATGMLDCSWYGGDSDADGLCDMTESYIYGTDPLDWDTDDGGACDGDEILLDDTNPFVPTDDVV